jgi:thioredoxin 1
MEYLDEQEEFERLIGRGDLHDPQNPVSGITIIYFGATWCGPCRGLAPRLSQLVESYPMIRWLKCDVDRNNYTSGFCGVKSIPAFLAINNTRIVEQAQISSAERLEEWVKQVLSKKTT